MTAIFSWKDFRFCLRQTVEANCLVSCFVAGYRNLSLLDFDLVWAEYFTTLALSFIIQTPMSCSKLNIYKSTSLSVSRLRKSVLLWIFNLKSQKQNWAFSKFPTFQLFPNKSVDWIVSLVVLIPEISSCLFWLHPSLVSKSLCKSLIRWQNLTCNTSSDSATSNHVKLIDLHAS